MAESARLCQVVGLPGLLRLPPLLLRPSLLQLLPPGRRGRRGCRLLQLLLLLLRRSPLLTAEPPALLLGCLRIRG